ncbi:MAG: S8 family serine peptidase, partial [Terracidiphilus sp.]
IQASHDPLKSSRYFVLAQPEGRLAKISENKTKAVDGKIYESTIFSEKHSRVFKRLGMDLIGVTESGAAVVHMKPELLGQLENSAHSLAELGAREKSRWATINRFEMVPVEAKVDPEWIRSIGKSVGDGVIELQPLLTRSETDTVIRAIVATLNRTLGERPEGTGTDYSGRQWFRAKLTAESLERIARDFFSIQSLHSPLTSFVARSSPAGPPPSARNPSDFDIDRLPVVGLLDTGVPANHSILSKYRRGAYVAPTSSPTATDSHGTFVSSRIVFGDPDYSGGPPARTPDGQARFYDVNVSGLNPGEIEDKSVLGAFQAVVSTAPDVRVFNMSFDARPLGLMEPVKQAESLALVQDLDNFIFQNDIIAVVSAGNSPPGVVPAQNYPQHFNDPAWALGPWARSFNSLTCGSYVGTLSPGGLAPEIGWPSPFCRVGPGLCDSPKPDFSASGGNSTLAYRFSPGLGEWGLSMGGLWEDGSGSSFAAPLLARECAFALDILQKVCDRGAQPFGVTVKAFLALTAMPPELQSAVRDLALRTLGRGTASVDRLIEPLLSTGVMVWQGVLDDDSDIAKIMVPIPKDWLATAEAPRLRLVLAWDPPVNAAVRDVWSTRHVSPKLKRNAASESQRPMRGGPAGTYPLIERRYDLRKRPAGSVPEDDEDFWLVEVEYEQAAEYHPAMVFPPQQRVAFAAEIFDE